MNNNLHVKFARSLRSSGEYKTELKAKGSRSILFRSRVSGVRNPAGGDGGRRAVYPRKLIPAISFVSPLRRGERELKLP